MLVGKVRTEEERETREITPTWLRWCEVKWYHGKRSEYDEMSSMTSLKAS